MKWAKPHEWNSGAPMIQFSRARSGMRLKSAAAGLSPPGCLRAAPFGVPVVPEVRMIVRPGSSGGETSSVEVVLMRSSSVGRASVSSSSTHAMKSLRPSLALLRTSVNSWS